MSETDPFATTTEEPTATAPADPFAESAPEPTAADIEPTTGDDIEAEVAAETPAADDAPEADVTPGPLETAPEDVEPEAEPEADLPIVNREGEAVAADAPEADVEPDEAAQEPVEAAPAPETAPAAPQAATTAAAPASGDTAPATGPRGGKGEMRLYRLLYQTGPRAWTEYDLSTVDAGALGVEIRQADEEHWMVARNNEHANRVAYAILGRPSEGVRCFPVPRGAWKPKTIKPAPPRPERESLVIS